MKRKQQWDVNSFIKKNYNGSLQTYSVKGTVRTYSNSSNPSIKGTVRTYSNSSNSSIKGTIRTYSEPSLKEKFIEFMEPRIREEDRESFSRAVLDLTNDEFLDFLNNENSEDKEVIEFKEVLDNEGYSKRRRSKVL